MPALCDDCAVYRASDPDFDPKEVARVMNSYIQPFFGCRECARNFANGAARIDDEIRRRDDAIMWLWRSHNVANSFLTDHITEDPTQAKIQFPSPLACSRCRAGEAGWRDAVVLSYLKRFYGRRTLIDDAISPVVSLPKGNQLLDTKIGD